MSQNKPLINRTTTMRDAMEQAMLSRIADTGSLPDVFVEGATVSNNAGVKKAPTWTVTRRRKGKR